MFKLCDQFGFNIYPLFEHKSIFKLNQTFKASSIGWKYFKYLSSRLIKSSDQKIFHIAELQAEPWQEERVSWDDAYANKTCNPDLVLEYISKLSQIGVKTILLWGTEFHIKCASRGNNEWIEKIYNQKH